VAVKLGHERTCKPHETDLGDPPRTALERLKVVTHQPFE
jgi:hypothetical protein